MKIKNQETMKAIVCTKFGAIDDVIELSNEFAKPVLVGNSDAKGHMLIRVLACSISPGDERNIDGSVDAVRNPKSWPWIPGHDVCGIVEQIRDDDDNAKAFKVGDCVVSTSSKVLMEGGLAEYALVETVHAAVKPASVSAVDAACLPTSAQRALQAVQQANAGKGTRALVLGGSGGFGLFLMQLLKKAGAFVVATSTQEALCVANGADKVINYSQEEWWTMEEFKKEKFDVVFDAESKRRTKLPWKLCGQVLKRGSRGGLFVMVTLDDPDVQLHSYCGVCMVMGRVAGRMLCTRVFRASPRCCMIASAQRRQDLEEVLQLVEKGELKVELDGGKSLPFTVEGARTAFHAIQDNHAHGKVCIRIGDE